MTLVLSSKASPPLKSSRRLARRLLEDAGGEGDERLIAAFSAFLALVRADDLEARASQVELQGHHQTAHPESYFLECLQGEFDRATKKRRGIYYTPGPVVDWIVRRIERLVPESPLRIVDPACGGGVFLLAAAQLARMRSGSTLIGYDVSAAAVAVSRRLLADSGVDHQIRQANPLLEGDELAADLLSGSPTNAAGPTLVILGNPPYANYGRLNRGPWIDSLLAEYRQGMQERKLNLTDDFIKFLRWAQHWIDRAGAGVLAMITSRTYLSGITHRAMRRSLLNSFDQIDVLDLHGDEQSGDENVFPIRRGVAIGIFASCGIRENSENTRSRRLDYVSLCGSRADKLAALSDDLPEPREILPFAPHWQFVPSVAPAARTSDDYHSWPRLDEIFVDFISGVQSKNDALFVDFDRDVLAARMRAHLEATTATFGEHYIQPYVVAPLDRRWIYYDPNLLGRARWSLLQSMVAPQPNIALIFMRQSTTADRYDHAFVVDCLASDRVFYSRRGAPFLAPLRRIDAGQWTSNLREPWVRDCEHRLGFRPSDDALLAYLYAVLHSPNYRHTHLHELQREFPRIPPPVSGERFLSLSAYGQQLIDCHLLRKDAPCPPESCGTDRCVARGYPRLWGDSLELNASTSLPGVNSDAWFFQIGGYQMIKRWLMSRQGRTLTLKDFSHVAQICRIALESARLSQQIDERA